MCTEPHTERWKRAKRGVLIPATGNREFVKDGGTVTIYDLCTMEEVGVLL